MPVGSAPPYARDPRCPRRHGRGCRSSALPRSAIDPAPAATPRRSTAVDRALPRPMVEEPPVRHGSFPILKTPTAFAFPENASRMNVPSSAFPWPAGLQPASACERGRFTAAHLRLNVPALGLPPRAAGRTSRHRSTARARLAEAICSLHAATSILPHPLYHPHGRYGTPGGARMRVTGAYPSSVTMQYHRRMRP